MGLAATFATDITAMLTHCGVSVTIGGVSDYGNVKISNAVQQSGGGIEYQTRVTTLLVKSGVFTLTNGVTVTADGIDYRLDEWQLEGDGALTRLILSRKS